MHNTKYVFKRRVLVLLRMYKVHGQIYFQLIYTALLCVSTLKASARRFAVLPKSAFFHTSIEFK
jgi:hypothetical protein